MPHAGHPSSRWFILQAEDPDTGCPAVEMRFEASGLLVLHRILGHDSGEDPDLRRSYSLDARQIAAITEEFTIAFDSGGYRTLLTPWHRSRETPYLIHTNFELALMLDGRKPLAAFCDAYPAEWLDEVVGRFDRHISEGRFIKRIIDRPFEKPKQGFEGMREVYVAAREQEWRIDAYILLREVAATAGWNDAFERYEGALLGYQDWENDWWIRQRPENNLQRIDAPTVIPLESLRGRTQR